MAIETPPPLNPAPTPAIQRGDRATFSDRVDAFISWLVPGVGQFNALGENVAHNASETFANSTAALGAAQSALKSAETATAAAQAASGTLVVATSTSSLAIGLGEKTFVTQAGKQFVVGVPIVAIHPDDTSNRMYGTVVSYADKVLVINVTAIGGGGTLASWNISIAGERGAAGSGALAGNATDAINDKRGGDVPVSASPDIWAAGGNLVLLTGNGTVTGFPPAPQAGATRRLIVTGAPSFVNGPNVVIKGGNCIMYPGDEAVVTAESTTRFLVTIIRQDGSATRLGSANGRLNVLYTSATFVVRKTGLHTVTLIGAGGSGGSVAFAMYAQRIAASGGGGGGLCVLTFFGSAGQSYVFTKGASGVSRISAATPTAMTIFSDGQAGGTSTFIGPGVNMVAGGGEGGFCADLVSPVRSGASLTGRTNARAAAGGIASGGDSNFTGGASGAALVFGVPTYMGLAMAASGGGAVSYFGNPALAASGSAWASIIATGGGNDGSIFALAATGGASPGGNSGTATSEASSGVLSSLSGGGGAGGNSFGSGGGPGIPLITTPPLNCIYPGSSVSATGQAPMPPAGCGSGGAAASLPTATVAGIGGQGGALSGGGGAVSSVNPFQACTAGSGGYGGGGGGAVANAANGYGVTAASGAGGPALCLIQEPA